MVSSSGVAYAVGVAELLFKRSLAQHTLDLQGILLEL